MAELSDTGGKQMELTLRGNSHRASHGVKLEGVNMGDERSIEMHARIAAQGRSCPAKAAARLCPSIPSPMATPHSRVGRLIRVSLQRSGGPECHHRQERGIVIARHRVSGITGAPRPCSRAVQAHDLAHGIPGLGPVNPAAPGIPGEYGAIEDLDGNQEQV